MLTMKKPLNEIGTPGLCMQRQQLYVQLQGEEADAGDLERAETKRRRHLLQIQVKTRSMKHSLLQ